MQEMKNESIQYTINHNLSVDYKDAGIPILSQPIVDEVGTIKPNTNFLYLVSKRLFDIILSMLAILITFPILMVTAIIIKLEDPKGKVLYIAPRGGKNGVAFPCAKLRSMRSDADSIKAKLLEQNEMSGPVFKIKDDPRVTKVGKFIRKTSIDELPQLFNVFLGQMSFVGPRPLPIAEENAVEGIYKTRELVTPGITCIWQISGRNNIDFDDWMKMDMEYIQKQSLLFDLIILLKTIPAVLTNKGAS